MQDSIVVILGFIGDWLLFSFPLLQAALELSEQGNIIGQFKEVGRKYPKVSPWYWLLPPLKLYLERQRVKKIIHDQDFAGIDRKSLSSFSARGTAWFYVALAGACNGIGETRELLEHFHWYHSSLLFWSVNLFMILLGIANVVTRIRITDERGQ